MPRADLTKYIAENLHSLPAEDGPIRFMHYSQFGRDEQTRTAVSKECARVGDAFGRLLERGGWDIRHKDDIQPADTTDAYKTVRIKCNRCGKELLTLGCDDQLTARLSALAIRALSQLAHEC
jgi:hypothetical protein